MKKVKMCPHKFSIERELFDGKTGICSALDMRCENCDMALFVNKPSCHFGDMGDRPFYATPWILARIERAAPKKKQKKN